MTVKVTLEFPTAADAADFLAGLDGADATVDAGTPPKRGRGRPPKAAPETVAPQALSQPAPTPAAAAPAAPAAPPAAVASVAQAAATSAQTPNTGNAQVGVPFKAVADAVTDLAEADRDKAVAVLAQFGAKRANDLKPEQYAAVVQACKAALAPPTQAAAAASLI